MQFSPGMRSTVLLRPTRLTQRSALLLFLPLVLVCKLPANHAPADCANGGVFAKLMSRHPTDHGAFDATCGVCGAYRRDRKRRGRHCHCYRTDSHSETLRNCVLRIWCRPASIQ